MQGMNPKDQVYPLIQRFRLLHERGQIGLAMWRQTEADLTSLYEDLDRLHEENERLKKIVDLVELKNENDALRLKLKELIGE